MLALVVAFLVGTISLVMESSAAGFATAGAGGVILGLMWLVRRDATEDALWLIFAGLVSRVTRFVWYRDRNGR